MIILYYNVLIKFGKKYKDNVTCFYEEIEACPLPQISQFFVMESTGL